MNLKLAAIAATVYGLQNVLYPRSIKPQVVDNSSKLAKRVLHLDSRNCLSNYNKVLVGSHSK